jgi:ABC-type glycerol-3-phosphate transport system permease component
MFDYAAAPPPNALARALRVAPKVSATLIMLALAAVWLGPIILIVMTSIKSNQAFLAGPFALPTSPTLAPYSRFGRA